MFSQVTYGVLGVAAALEIALLAAAQLEIRFHVRVRTFSGLVRRKRSFKRSWASLAAEQRLMVSDIYAWKKSPSAAFSQRAAALLGSRLVACVERYPDDAVHSVLVVTVDRDAESWQPRLKELHAELVRDGGDSLAPVQLEVLDRATVLALERLEAAGLIHSRVRATRHLHPVDTEEKSPLTDEEKTRAAEFRRQAAKKLKLAKILLAEDMPEEAIEALREATRLTGCALAVEQRLGSEPATLAAALAPPHRLAWGEAADALQPLVAGNDAAPTAALAALARVLNA